MINDCLHCDLPCSDVNKESIVAHPEINPDGVRLVMISEAPTGNPDDFFYADPGGSFFRNTQTAFADAGFTVASYADLTDLGVYLTTAIKCSKHDYLVGADTLKACSLILEQEIGQFHNIRVVMCMGDFAIKAVNYIARRVYKTRAIPAGSTYKIRQGEFELDGVRYFPSYTQTGPSFDIEKSKRTMIAEDISRAMAAL
jgi:uracil-DNA glycosylase